MSMKKAIPFIVFALILGIIIATLSTCVVHRSYEEASNTDYTFHPFSDGYFITVKEWDGGANYAFERIVYAYDTRVMYYVYSFNDKGGITPLYNADGTLQIYEGK